jgi:hypothetical protein
MTLIAAGAGSTGGLRAFAMKRIFFEPSENMKQTKLEEGKNESSRQKNGNRIGS